MKKILKMCMNGKVLLLIGVVILLAYLFVPNIARYSWILLALACPIFMMLVMARMKRDSDTPKKVFVCQECNLSYQDAEWEEKCAAWCKEHHSCNLEITKHAIE